MGDFPFTAREMTAVHLMFMSGAQVAIDDRRQASLPGAAKRTRMRASNATFLDRAFDTIAARARKR